VLDFNADMARRSRAPVVVFDLGGTRFRAAVLDENDEIVRLRETPSIGRRNRVAPVPELQRQMLDHILETGKDLCANAGVRSVAVSIGAAVNHVTGRVVGSAPLWGSELCDFDLEGCLRRACPHLRWTVLNDVTALATDLLTESTAGDFVAAVTVSSGIAYRAIDLRTGAIPVDPDNGLQGEIGHLPAEAFWRGRRLDARCDCGALRHVASFSSGPGIHRLLCDDPELAALTSDWADTAAPETDLLDAFCRRVHAGDPVAQQVLDTATRPLAQVLLYQATLNPQVAQTVLSGGVVAAFGSAYLDSVLRNLELLGLYAVSGQDADYFRRRVRLGRLDGLSALRGAGLRARGMELETEEDNRQW